MQPKSRLHSMKVSSRIASDNKLRVRQWKRKTTAKISACHWIHRTASCRISKQKCQSPDGTISQGTEKKRFMNKGQSFWFGLSFVILQASQIRKKRFFATFFPLLGSWRKWRNEFSSLRRYGFYVVATIRCSISLALLFTKLMMSAWCSVSLFCSPWHCTTFICSSENSTVSTLCSAILAEKMMQSGLSE